MKVKLFYSVLFLTVFLFGASNSFGQDNLIIKRPGKADVKIALNAYSFTKPLLNYSKNRSGEKMSLFELIDWCAVQGFDGVDLTGYYFPNYPELPSDEFIYNLKKYAHTSGIIITGTGVRNNFADPDPANRAADVKHVKEWIDVAAKLGAPVVRIFAGPVPSGYENKWDEVAGYMAESIKECADYGKEKGILLGVQNHGDFLKTADETIKLLQMVNSEWFGVIVDTGYFLTPDPYVDIEKVMPYAVNFQLKESAFGAASVVPIDLERIMEIIKRTGYRGYLPIETLSKLGGNKARKQAEQAAAAAAGTPNTTSGKKNQGGKAAKEVASKATQAATSNKASAERSTTVEKKSGYDPYTAVPVFYKKVKAAQKAAFGEE